MYCRFPFPFLTLLLAFLVLVPDTGKAQNAFITTWETTTSNESITIPTDGFFVSDYDFQIDWGDGTVEQVTGDDPDPTHTYATAGTHTVEITGSFPRFYLDDIFDSDPNADKLQSIEQWGAIQWETMQSAFAGAENMVLNATDAPDLSNVADMSSMFWGADALNEDLSSWDVSGVTDMAYLFYSADAFNGDVAGWTVSNVTDMQNMFNGSAAFNRDISGWNVSSVTNMSGMFDGASSFNQDISGWTVSQVTSMDGMFWGATSFNQPIGQWTLSQVTDMSAMFWNADSFNQDLSGWDVSSVTDMSYMFYDNEIFNQDIGGWTVSEVVNMANMFDGADAFNRDISQWDVSRVTDMSGMFNGATSFNQPIGGWTVSNVTNMSSMFWNADSFDQDISDWDVGRVTDMSYMFYGNDAFNQNIGGWTVLEVTDMASMFNGATAFNQNISSWNVSRVTDMSGMFDGASAFNQDISNWVVSEVTDMSSMFWGADAFNQNIGTWDVSRVTDMSYMFYGAEAFDQDLSAWDVSEVADFSNFLTSIELSPENYDALLIGWEQRDLRDGLTFDAGESQYTSAAENARASIIQDDGWTINDGGLAPEATVTENVSADGFVDFGATGVNIDFADVSGSGDVVVERYAYGPEGTDGISESNVSDYRLVITAGGSLDFGFSTEVRFPVSSFGGINDPTAVTVYRRFTAGSGTFSALSTTVDDGGTSGDISDDVLVVSTGFFSEFVFASDTNPLPVELMSFSGIEAEGGVRLTWRTASETHNAGFHVERKHSGADWDEIGYVAGSGTTSESRVYRFNDASPPFKASSLTYRLRQVDLDGSVQHSEPISVTITPPERTNLLAPYPNPSRGHVQIRYSLPESSPVRLAMYDALGRQVRLIETGEQSAGNHEITISASRLASGIYFLRLSTPHGAFSRKMNIIR